MKLGSEGSWLSPSHVGSASGCGEHPLLLTDRDRVPLWRALAAWCCSGFSDDLGGPERRGLARRCRAGSREVGLAIGHF